MTAPQQPGANGSLADDWAKASEGIQGLDKFVGTVKEAWFDTNTNLFDGGSDYGESVICVLECSIDQKIEPADYPFDDARLYFSVGKSENWDIVNGGKEIVAKKGGQMGNSKYQQLMARTTNSAEKDGLAVPLAERGLSWKEANVWVGLAFTFQQEQKPLPERLIREGGPTHSRITLPSQWMQNAVPAPLA